MTHSCDDNGHPLDPQHPWNKPEESIQKQKERAFSNKLKNLERAFKDGNLGALDEVLQLCDQQTQPIPAWGIVALRASLEREMNGKSAGKKGHSKWITRYADDMRDLDRYEAVLEGREKNIRWLDVYGAVSEMLYGSEDYADAIEKAYKRVARRMADNPGRYLILKNRL